MNKILITGGTGFVGKRLVKSLLQDNKSLTLLSRSIQPNVKTIICDFESEKIPKNAMNGIDTVFHLAGYTHDNHKDSKVNHLYQKINVDTSIQLLYLAISSGVKRFVFVSSVKAGGSAEKGKVMTEKDQNIPEGIYGMTKRDAEVQLVEIACKSSIHLSIVRPSLVYGPDLKGNLSAMFSGIKKGWFPPLPYNRNRRSLIHVDDLVRALIFVASISHENGEIYNATDSKSYSSREIYETMCSLLNRPIPNWSIPKSFFYILGLLNPKIKYKVNKLLGDDFHSSQKLESLGFNCKHSLREMNETSF
jgi:UDP-glucose 4-epimerase